MKTINELKEGQNVIFSSLPQTFTIKKVNSEKNTVSLFIQDTDIERETSITNVFPITEHTVQVSKFARETRNDVKRLIPFGVTLNDRIIKKMFLNHWIAMCENEYDPKAYEIAKADFALFVQILKDRLEILNNLNIDGIRLIAPTLPDNED